MFKNINVFLITFLLMIISITASAQLPDTPSSITLSWSAPSTRENGDSLDVSQLAGYELTNSCGGLYTIEDGAVTSYTLSVVLPYDCTFTVNAVDTDGLRSLPSDPLQVKFNAPVAPVFNTIQIN